MEPKIEGGRPSLSISEAETLALANPITPVMERACGTLLGRMDTVLKDFQHEGAILRRVGSGTCRDHHN